MADQTAEEIEAEKELQAEIEAAADAAEAAPKAWKVTAKYLPDNVREGAIKLLQTRSLVKQRTELAKFAIDDELPRDAEKRFDQIVTAVNTLSSKVPGLFKSDVVKQQGSGTMAWKRYGEVKGITVPTPQGDVTFTVRVRTKAE